MAIKFVKKPNPASNSVAPSPLLQSKGVSLSAPKPSDGFSSFINSGSIVQHPEDVKPSVLISIASAPIEMGDVKPFIPPVDKPPVPNNKSPAAFLKPLKDVETLSKVGLVERLHLAMSVVQGGRLIEAVHASDLTNEEKEFCPREFCFYNNPAFYAKAKKQAKSLPTWLKATFDLGEDLHDRVRNDWGFSYSLGHWKCLGCGQVHKGLRIPKTDLHAPITRPANCFKCSAKKEALVYEEVRLTHPVYKYRMGIDWICDLPGFSKRIAVEIKSIEKDAFKALQAPLAEHSLRTMLYLGGLNSTGYGEVFNIDTEQAVVLYICKGAGSKKEFANPSISNGLSPFKEFAITYDESKVAPYYELSKVANETSKIFVQDHQTLPPRLKACSKPMTARACSCKFATSCFSIKG